MLFLLTGEVQIGKTRWLEGLAAELTRRGVPVAGVLAPGQWVPSAGERADANGFEKLGIDNVLLPSGERVPFARRDDLARADGTFDAESQAARAELAWHISDDAIARVNAHFDALAGETESAAAGASSGVMASGSVVSDGAGSAAASVAEASGGALVSGGTVASGAANDGSAVSPGLLIVDELGRLELWRGEGLTSAVALLQRGPTAVFPHALVTVRDYLADRAEALLAPAWPDIVRIEPTVEAEQFVFSGFLGS